MIPVCVAIVWGCWEWVWMLIGSVYGGSVILDRYFGAKRSQRVGWGRRCARGECLHKILSAHEWRAHFGHVLG